MDRWIDLVTCAIPRLTTRRSMESFVATMEDRADWKIRWVFHLDYPVDDHLQQLFAENAEMAKAAASLFDDSVLLLSDHNLGYGGSLLRVLGRVEHETFYHEDDWLWQKPWNLRRALELSAGERFVYWMLQWNVWKWQNKPDDWRPPPFRPGATCPSIWPRSAIQRILANPPRKPQHMTERAISAFMSRNGYRSVLYDENHRTHYVRDIGRRMLRHPSGKSPHSRRYVDSETNTPVKIGSDRGALQACEWRVETRSA